MFDSISFKRHQLDEPSRADEPAELGQQHVRFDIDASLTMASGNKVSARVIDISRSGVRLKVASPLPVGEQVELQLGRCGYVRVLICWSRGSEATGRLLDID